MHDACVYLEFAFYFIFLLPHSIASEASLEK